MSYFHNFYVLFSFLSYLIKWWNMFTPTSVKFSLSQSYLEAVNNYKPLQLNLVSELHL